jgi:HEAT repeat protein
MADSHEVNNKNTDRLSSRSKQHGIGREFMSGKLRLKRTFRWILSFVLVVLGLSVTWAWGRVARLAEPSPEDAGSQVAALYAVWQPSEAGQRTLFRSTDAGATWQPLSLPRAAAPEIWVSDGDQRLAAFVDGGFLFRSVDRGETWTTVETDLPVVSLAWGEDGSLYLGTDGYGVYQLTSDDTLVSLAAAGSELATSSVRNMAYVDGRLFAATSDVLFTTDDGGETWAKSLPVTGTRISALAASSRDTVFVGTDTSGVLRSTDGGWTWQPALEGLGLAAGQMVQITALRTDLQEPNVLYAALDYLLGGTELHASAGGTFVSVDNGAQWQSLAGPTFPQAEHATGLVIAEDKPLYVQAVTANGLQAYSPDVPTALAALESKDTHARLNAIRILGLARAEEASPSLLSAVADPDPLVSTAAADALARIDSPAAVSGLLVALDHPDEQVQVSAGRALGMMGVEGAVQSLRAMLMNGDGKAISTAAEALGRIGSPGAIDALLAALADPEMTPRRHAALAALESIGEPAVGALTNMLSNSDPYARTNAAQALGWIGSPSATRALVQTLDDRSSLVRDQAAWALGEIGDPAAQKALERAAQRDPSTAVQAEASRALARIEQQPATTTRWSFARSLAGLAPALNRLQALRWLFLAASLLGAGWLAATNARLSSVPVLQRANRR